MKSKEHEWAEIEDTWALINVKKEGNNSIFSSTYGIPLTLEVCEKCGEIRLFSAKKLGRF